MTGQKVRFCITTDAEIRHTQRDMPHTDAEIRHTQRDTTHTDAEIRHTQRDTDNGHPYLRRTVPNTMSRLTVLHNMSLFACTCVGMPCVPYNLPVLKKSGSIQAGVASSRNV
jgi:hypothetical protein